MKKVVAVLFCSLLALPVSAQESKATSKPRPVTPAEKVPAERAAEPKKAPKKRGVTLVWTEIQWRPAGVALPGADVPLGVIMKDKALLEVLQTMSSRPVPRSFSATVPNGRRALDAAQRQLDKARSARDLQGTLRALDELERQVMRARAALHKASRKTTSRPRHTETQPTKR